MQKARWGFLGFVAALALTGGSAVAIERLKPVTQVLANDGLSGGGTGPTCAAQDRSQWLYDEPGS